MVELLTLIENEDTAARLLPTRWQHEQHRFPQKYVSVMEGITLSRKQLVDEKLTRTNTQLYCLEER
jgi:hypothetical protein